MPIATVRVPSGAFGAEQRQRIVDGLSRAIAEAEQIPDDPARRARVIVIWDELTTATIYANGADTSAIAIPVFVGLQPPDGALTDDRAAAFVGEVERLFVEHGADDGRFVTTSVIISPVADGSWGIAGRISRLPDFARTAGYEHLQHLVV
jgi:phenylpyruvate tautomerase PptA (4-oxalocrotonate tautomerase family)